MNPFATELLVHDRVRELYDISTEPGGTTRIAARLQRFEDEQITTAEPSDWTTGPIDQRRDAA